MDTLNLYCLFVLLPFAVSLSSVFTESVWLYVILLLSHFLILLFVPVFKGRENLWMFIAVAISSIPVNVLAVISLWRYDIAEEIGMLNSVLLCILYYAVLFSIEEIVMGLITRLIWKRQIKLPITYF